MQPAGSYTARSGLAVARGHDAHQLRLRRDPPAADTAALRWRAAGPSAARCVPAESGGYVVCSSAAGNGCSASGAAADSTATASAESLPALSGSRSPTLSLSMLSERLVGFQTAVARARQRGVGAATAVGQHRGTAALDLLLLVTVLGLLGGELGLRADVNAPAGQAGGETGVLSFASDRQRELVVGHDHGGLLGLVVDEHLAHTGGRERLGDEPARARR